ncbi:S-adenosyl-L-methionine-dependent methyltransferase [Myriangium duriaei CBS 260.36]|uniref:S-adenosyl-L-methionine-dependent methyltransferase n=1 Tax=Myriangium duriaei CBS 260.36 TaxID=1168546 RepID=A0A9P4MS52_9PEZI|nr:S-adenosyl-L-methionine-dependent methyltransferase [Myriangium duriaei CBS 260.36]
MRHTITRSFANFHRPQLATKLHPCSLRCYAVQTPGAPIASVFNNAQKITQRDRAATNAELSRSVDYLRDEIGSRLVTRLLDINRSYDRVLDYGANACNLARILTHPDPDPDSSKPVTEPLSSRIGTIVSADSSAAMLHRDEGAEFEQHIKVDRQVLEHPEAVPFEDNSFDLALSNLSLHWINDLPSVLTGINRVLKPDCALLAAMPGGDSLYELRGALQLADMERRGGIATHVSPLADVRDVGNLLNRAGFKLLTVDVDDIVVSYPDVMALMRDLQAMGESNASLRMETGPIQRDVLLALDSIYRELYGDEDGSIPATFRTIYMIGWKEGEGQAKPLERGSGDINMKDFLEGKK